jgi:hypothetical protein
MGTKIEENRSHLGFVWDLGQRKMEEFGFFYASGNFEKRVQVSPS